MRGLRRRAAIAVLAVTMTTVGASAASNGAAPQQRHGPPDQVNGLTVQKEDIAKVLAADHRPLYTDRIGLFSYREGKLLQATLEIAHFRSGSPWASTDFQQSIVGHLGSTVPIVIRVGSQRVYITTSKGLIVAVWFDPEYMLTLAIRKTYKQPKELIRQSLAVNP